MRRKTCDKITNATKGLPNKMSYATKCLKLWQNVKCKNTNVRGKIATFFLLKSFQLHWIVRDCVVTSFVHMFRHFFPQVAIMVPTYCTFCSTKVFFFPSARLLFSLVYFYFNIIISRSLFIFFPSPCFLFCQVLGQFPVVFFAQHNVYRWEYKFFIIKNCSPFCRWIFPIFLLFSCGSFSSLFLTPH